MSKINLGGRPKTSGIWDYFKYNLDTNCSECIIVGAKDLCEKSCQT